MLSFVLAFLSGDLLLQGFRYLPAAKYIFLLVGFVFVTWVFLRKNIPYLYLILAMAIGFAWSYWYAYSILSWTLPKTLEGQVIIVKGCITSIPISDKFGTHFEFLLNNNLAKVLLTWGNEKYHLKVGDEWRLKVKLKRIHSIQSPAAFDFEAWALQKSLRARGMVVDNRENHLLAHHWLIHPIDQLRQKLKEKIKIYLPATHSSPWLNTLIIGEHEGVDPSDWEILRKTGTNHLMAIAGLHIGMMSGFIYLLVGMLWRRSARLITYLPTSHAGACAALIAAVTYSSLAGFSLPTQRACVMLIVFTMVHVSKRKINSWNSWAIAMFAVLVLNPLVVLSESFWLSFGTIALIIYGMNARIAPSGWWWKWGRVQWVISLGLFPLTLKLFHQYSFISFIANTIAIPWLGFIVLPLCLSAALFVFTFPLLAKFMLFLADKNLTCLWWVLEYLSHFAVANFQYAIPNLYVYTLTIIGVILLLLPSGAPGRWFAIIFCLPLFLWQPIKPKFGDVWMTLLDVGQGLSVVIQTESHIMIYDAGPKLGDKNDMGEQVIIPYLQQRKAQSIDKLVISHGDNDHIGGAAAIIHAFPVTNIETSAPKKISAANVSVCLADTTWNWDGVRFTYLYPQSNQLNSRNDSSCVLRIDNGKQSILLTGDIEKYAEKDLVKRVSEKLHATILIAPHHGSKTSAVPKFIATVHPKYVLYATGYRNRYHFPHANVVSEYKLIGANQYNTSETGTMNFELMQNKAAINYHLYRVEKKRYWMD